MATTRFLANAGLWGQIKRRVETARRIRAAIAYFGKDGADLVRLREGDTLLVDMSLGAVRQGATNPYEIAKLVRRKVRVFTRASLHAKFLLADNTLIVSSANASRNSEKRLDEAGIITTDSAAVKRAGDFLRRMCTEPVRSEYLKECKKSYQPPTFKALRVGGGKRRQRERYAKLWLVGGLRYADVPRREQSIVEALVKKLARKYRLPQDSVTEVHYPAKERFFRRLRCNEDWILQCVLDDKSRSRFVEAPARLLDIMSYPRGRGKRRWVMFLEVAPRAASMSLRRFRSRVRRTIPVLDRESPRTHAIEDDEQADALLGLWTHSGQIARRAPTLA